MENDVVLGWLVVGLLIGGLTLVLGPSRSLGGFMAILGAAALGTLLGGWGWGLLVGSGPATLLGGAIVGVVGTLVVLYALKSIDRRRYGV